MKTILSGNEYNVLNNISHQTKMDCWFHICVEDGGDYVEDLEQGFKMDMREGVEALNEGIIPELLNLTDEEIETYVNLLKQLHIPYNPFEEYSKVATEIYGGRTMNRFPKDCWNKNCPHFKVWDMSIDDLCCRCEKLNVNVDACDTDFSPYFCPLTKKEDIKEK